VAVHADGVAHGHTPALISVTPGALSVRVPIQVAEGPNVVDGEKKRRLRSISRKKETTTPTTITTEEKGTVNVN